MKGNANALILADIQQDFMPGGALSVAGGDEILEGVRRLIEHDAFEIRVATQDWHPPGHVSFASSHAGRKPLETIVLYGHDQTLWPDHCVQGTPGAGLHPDLPWDAIDAVIRKGVDPDCDSYSGFRNNWNRHGRRPPTGLAGYLRERGADALYLCGLARDVCVQWTAEDAAAEGFQVRVVWDLTRPVDAGSDDRVRADLERAGVTLVDSGELTGRRF